MGSILKVKNKNGEWVGVPAIKGDKGEDGMTEITSVDNIVEAGIYNFDNDLYRAKSIQWNTDLSVPFKYNGDGAIPELDFDYGNIEITGEGGMGVICSQKDISAAPSITLSV